MIPALLDFAEAALVELEIPVGRALEVGSFHVNGTIRHVFQHRAESYTGVDSAPGSCVDLVLDGEKLVEHFPINHFDTVLCFETLEHTVRPWVVVEQMKAVLKSGGYLWVSTPTFGFPLHRHPVDCYRFGEDAYRLWLFSGMELLKLATVRDEHRNPVIAAVGRKL